MREKFVGKYSDTTGKVLGAFFQLHKELGYGFSEKVYQSAFAMLLEEMGLVAEQQKRILVYFHGKIVGEYVSEMIVNSVILLEINSVERLIPAHDAQMLNYLKATEIEVGLLLNFGATAEFHRKIYDNSRKGALSWTKAP